MPTKKCLYCGENPIPHWPFWLFESMEVTFSPIRIFIYKIFPRLNPEWVIPDSLLIKLFRFFNLFGIISYNTDISDVKNNRARVLWQEAIDRSIPFKELRLFGKTIDCYHAKINNKEILFFGLPRPNDVADTAIHWLDDKADLKKILKKNNLPIPDGGAYSLYQIALRKFESLSKPVIVKPRRGSRGRHTTTFIYSKEDFKKAFKIAKQLCHWVIVEEQLFGDVFRGTLVDGKLAGVLGGSHPTVTGDGKYNIEQLIELKNKNKNPKVKDIKISDHTKLYLSRQKLQLQDIPAANSIVELSEKIGINYGGTSYEVIETTHADTKQMLEDCAKVIKSPILGFDFIIQDITKSYKEQKCGIIECNGNPFINLHHDPLIGNPQNVATLVWDLVS